MTTSLSDVVMRLLSSHSDIFALQKVEYSIVSTAVVDNDDQCQDKGGVTHVQEDKAALVKVEGIYVPQDCPLLNMMIIVAKLSSQRM